MWPTHVHSELNPLLTQSLGAFSTPHSQQTLWKAFSRPSHWKNANWSSFEILPHPIRMTKIQETVTTKPSKDVRKQWECKLVQSLWKPVPRSLQNQNYHRVPATLLFNICPRLHILPQRVVHSMFMAYALTITRKWNQSRCILINEWIMKILSIYTKGLYFAIRKNIKLWCLQEKG